MCPSAAEVLRPSHCLPSRFSNLGSGGDPAGVRSARPGDSELILPLPSPYLAGALIFTGFSTSLYSVKLNRRDGVRGIPPRTRLRDIFARTNAPPGKGNSFIREFFTTEGLKRKESLTAERCAIQAGLYVPGYTPR